MKKRLGALLCALVMCLALLSPASALEEVCFTSLNNKLLPLASDTMPLWSGGVLYVPASLFDGSATNSSYGVTLGVSLTQSQSSGTITLYSLSGILVFDLNSGICVDQQTGELLSGRAITRNGRIYLPLNIVVDFFGLRSSYLHTDYGYLVRIKNRDDTASNGRRSILTDEVFIDSAGNQMNLQLKEYQKSLLPVEEPETPDVLWLNVDIRAGVDKQHRTRKRQHRGYRRALYTSYSANDERGAGMQRAGISRADESIALSVAQHPESDSHRRVALFANDAQRLILHSYNAVGMNDTNTVKLGLSARSACGIAYLVLASDDDIAVLRHCRSRVEHTDNARLRRIVSAHYVDYYLHPLSLRRALTLRSRRPLLRLRRHASARARAYSRSPRCGRRQYSCPCS